MTEPIEPKHIEDYMKNIAKTRGVNISVLDQMAETIKGSSLTLSKEQQAIWIALIASGIWLLHPYFVSTTLYVVQRMAQLATLFTLIGIIGYLKARLLLAHKPILAYFYMALSIGLCTILATYSKEKTPVISRSSFINQKTNSYDKLLLS